MVSIFESFDRIRIVNLPERTDRKREIERELQSVGLKCGDRVSFFSAIRPDDSGPFQRIGSHGAYKSHLAILQEAAANGENVLILQDDCQFLPAARQYELPEDTDIFYGGYIAEHPDDLENSPIIGAHFMGFSADAAAKAAVYLEALLNPAFPPDPQASRDPAFDPKIRPPIDGALVWFRRAHPELKTRFAMLSIQRYSKTDVGDPGILDKIPALTPVIRCIRYLRNRLRGHDN